MTTGRYVPQDAFWKHRGRAAGQAEGRVSSMACMGSNGDSQRASTLDTCLHGRHSPASRGLSISLLTSPYAREMQAQLASSRKRQPRGAEPGSRRLQSIVGALGLRDAPSHRAGATPPTSDVLHSPQTVVVWRLQVALVGVHLAPDAGAMESGAGANPRLFLLVSGSSRRKPSRAGRAGLARELADSLKAAASLASLRERRSAG